MDTPTIDFWISIGSTYSYLSVMRVDEVAKATGINFRWRPFSVRAIMIEQNNVPFRGKPVKMNYMWRDIERRAQMYNLPARLPAPYPLSEFDLANKVAIVGEDKDWGKAYIQATYRRWFQNGEEAGLEPNLSESLREAGQRPEAIIEQARSEPVERRYQQATQHAKSSGVFGSPTFVVNGEIFWGDDRLEDAIDWLRHGRIRSRQPAIDNPLFDQVVAFLIWIKLSSPRPPAICGMRHNALILIAWYSWFAVLLGALAYFLIG